MHHSTVGPRGGQQIESGAGEKQWNAFGRVLGCLTAAEPDKTFVETGKVSYSTARSARASRGLRPSFARWEFKRQLQSQLLLVIALLLPRMRWAMTEVNPRSICR